MLPYVPLKANAMDFGTGMLKPSLLKLDPRTRAFALVGGFLGTFALLEEGIDLDSGAQFGACFAQSGMLTARAQIEVARRAQFLCLTHIERDLALRTAVVARQHHSQSALALLGQTARASATYIGNYAIRLRLAVSYLRLPAMPH